MRFIATKCAKHEVNISDKNLFIDFVILVIRKIKKPTNGTRCKNIQFIANQLLASKLAEDLHLTSLYQTT
jgi:hypothetical protein